MRDYYTVIDQVDEALDAYVRFSREKNREPQGFSPTTIRGFLNRVRRELKLDEVDYVQTGSMLQQYRVGQDQRRPRAQVPRFVIASRGYGRAARWFILTKPGSDPKHVQHARRQQVEWAIEDMTARWASDVAHELAPSLHGTALDRVIENAVTDVTGHLEVVYRSLERNLREVTTA